MWKQFKKDALNIHRSLYMAVCLMYLAILLLPMTIVSAQETATVPETTASSPQSEAPIPETVTPNPTPSETTTPTPEQPVQPPEEQDQKYTYNPETGKWENGKYTWDPNTRQSAPITQPNYSYNPETSRWDTKEWVYSPDESKYIAPTQVKPVIITPNLDIAVQPNKDSLVTKDLSMSKPIDTPTLKLSQSDDQGYFDLYFDAKISTTHTSNAISGNAKVLQNTVAGNAISGNALAMVNIINMVQSVWGWQGLLPEFYTADIQGDYYGDILINPASLGTANNSCGCQDTVVNNTMNGSIENNVDLLAKSGDVQVAGNTEAGSAISGDAAAIANIINLINTSMVAGQSFIGNININGSLEGDILMPENFLNSLIASNIPKTQMDISSTDIDLNSTTSIDNNINANASSGKANVSNNTIAGDAQTGDAQSNVTIFNLTNRSVVGANALLVFVNVAGEWVGFITDAPEGATVAMLGGGITNNSCLVCGTGTDSNINSDMNASITNNVNVNAQTGDANVEKNTTAGNAITGNAVAMVNTSNVTSSSVSLSGWFGILFINVLDNWLGSFGTNTAYGNDPKQTDTTSQPPTESNSGGAAYSSDPYQSTGPASKPGQDPAIRTYVVSFEDNQDDRIVLASANEIPTPPIHPAATNSSNTSSSGNEDLAIVALVTLLATAGVAGAVYRTKLQFLIGKLVG